MSKNLDSKIANNNNNKIDKWLNAIVDEPEPSNIPKKLIEDLSDNTIRDIDEFMEYMFWDNDREKIYQEPKSLKNPDTKNLSLIEYERRVLNIIKW